uniref:Poly(A) polymerase RNA-binding domain-containing protein n=1 Tax=Romanomermis culicivorax TaxID=13658 RepID=A0A915I7B2_ROMCU
SPVSKVKWDQLFQSPNFFASKYRHFIQLVCSASNKEDHMTWSGLVESKIRLLITNFERNPGVQLVHVNPEQLPPLAKKTSSSSSTTENSADGNRSVLPPCSSSLSKEGEKTLAEISAAGNRSEKSPSNVVVVETSASTPCEIMWFMGLDLNKGDVSLRNIDLTQDIRSFVETVQRHAQFINVFRE